MTEVRITQILDDLYMQGRLDDGEHIEDFAMWVGFYEVKRDRETALKQL